MNTPNPMQPVLDMAEVQDIVNVLRAQRENAHNQVADLNGMLGKTVRQLTALQQQHEVVVKELAGAKAEIKELAGAMAEIKQLKTTFTGEKRQRVIPMGED